MFFIKREKSGILTFPLFSPFFFPEYRGELAGKDIWTHIKYNQGGCVHPAAK